MLNQSIRNCIEETAGLGFRLGSSTKKNKLSIKSLKVSSKKFASNSFYQRLEEIWQWYQSSNDYLEVSTSGTSGPPKVIGLKRSEILASARLSIDHFGLNKDSRILICLPLTKIGGIMLAIRAFEARADIVLIEPQVDPLKLIEEDQEIDFVSLAPNQAAASKDHWHKCKQILIGGGPISAKLEGEIMVHKGNSEFWHSYASTETLSHVALRRIGETTYSALAGVEFKLSEQDTLVINAANLGIKDLETNDLVQLIDSWTFIWIGRKDNVVLSGGLKLYPETIEAKIEFNFPFFLAARADDSLGQKLVMVVEEDHYDLNEIKQKLSQLSGLERPKELIVVAQISFTEAKKIKRKDSHGKQLYSIKL